MRIFKPVFIALCMIFPWLIEGQIPAPQINLSGNIGCQGFPCVNSGTLVMATDANHTMTAQETSAFYIKVTSSVTLTATRSLIFPAGKFPVGIENATTGGQALSVCGPSGACVSIPNSTTTYTAVWNDGTNFVNGTGSGGGGGPTTLTGAVTGTGTGTVPTVIANMSGIVAPEKTVPIGNGSGVLNPSDFLMSGDTGNTLESVNGDAIYIGRYATDGVFTKNLDVDSTKITSVANGTASTDAVNFGQLSGLSGTYVQTAPSGGAAQTVLGPLSAISLNTVINAALSGASGSSTTTTTSATFGVGTSGTVTSCSTFNAGNGLTIAGAGVAGALYVGQVVSCSGSALVVTPATSTSVVSGTIVSHDDTAALQSAVNTGQDVFVPCGSYNISSAITFSTYPQIFNGGGQACTIFVNRGTTNDVFRIDYSLPGGYTTSTAGVKISGFSINQASGVTPTDGYAIHYGSGSAGYYTSAFIARDITINNTWGGIYADDGAISNWIEDIYINHTVGGSGFYYATGIPGGDTHVNSVEMNGANTGLTIAQSDTTTYDGLKINGSGVVFTAAGATANVRFVNLSVENAPSCGVDFGTVTGANAALNASFVGGEFGFENFAFCNTGTPQSWTYSSVIFETNSDPIQGIQSGPRVLTNGTQEIDHSAGIFGGTIELQDTIGTGSSVALYTVGNASPVGTWPNFSEVLEGNSANSSSGYGPLILDALGGSNYFLRQINRVNVETLNTSSDTIEVPLIVPQIIVTGATPTLAPGPAAGTSPSCTTISGANMAGKISCTTGTSPSASAILATITFNGTVVSAPQGCAITPTNAASAAVTNTIYTVADTFGVGWNIEVGVTALAASTAYAWSYSCI